MAGDTKFYPGELVFDRKRTDPTDDVLVVTDIDVGTVGDLTGEKYEAVKMNTTNMDLRPGDYKQLSDDTRVINAAYVADDKDTPAVISNEYTFPAFRLKTVNSPEDCALDGYQPHQVALSKFYAELANAVRETDMTVETTRDLKVLAMKASVDGGVILRGEDEMVDGIMDS